MNNSNTSHRAKALPPYTALVQSHNDLKTRYDTLRNTWEITVNRIRSIHGNQSLSLKEKYASIVQLFIKTDDEDDHTPLIFSILGKLEEL